MCGGNIWVRAPPGPLPPLPRRRGDQMPERMSIDELLALARVGLDRVPPAELRAEQDAGALVADIRPVEQRTRDGELPGAVVIDRNVLEWRLDPASPFRISEVTGYDCRVVIVCDQGYSSSLAADTLRRLGLHRATDLIGGFQAWLAWLAQAQPDGRGPRRQAPESP